MSVLTFKSDEFKTFPTVLRDYASYTAVIKGNSEKTVCEYLLDLRTFFRYWQQEFTESPVSYQLRRRLEVAARYLRCSDLDMPTVAEKSGFSTAGYFSRMFKKYNGKTPNEYRRNCRLNGGREK